MKQILYTLAVLSFLSPSAVFAQEGDPQKPDERRHENRQLLSEEQQAEALAHARERWENRRGEWQSLRDEEKSPARFRFLENREARWSLNN